MQRRPDAMGFLTRRQPPQPVEVRRPPAEPLPPGTVVIPNFAAPQPPPAPSAPAITSHVTQNFFYPAPPASTPPAAPVAAPPSFSTTVHHHYARRSERKLSFSGTVGLVLGVLACASTAVPPAQVFTPWLALGGVAAGGLGMLSSVLLGLTRVGVPLLAIVVAAVGYGLSLRAAGSSSPLAQLRSAIPAQLQDLHWPNDLSSVAPPKTPAPLPLPPPEQPAVVQQPPRSAASADLEAARIAAGRSMGIDYAALVVDHAAAVAALQQARATLPLGSPDLAAASERFMRADAALVAARQRLQSDPAVTAATAASK